MILSKEEHRVKDFRSRICQYYLLSYILMNCDRMPTLYDTLLTQTSSPKVKEP
jgi:hypothetical protein